MKLRDLSNLLEAEVVQRLELSRISAKLKGDIIKEGVKTFSGKGFTNAKVESILRDETDWNLSRALLINGKLAGFYLLTPGSVLDHQKDSREDLSRYNDKKGVEGIALVVKPEYRGKGYGNLLKGLPKKLGFDYVFGEQLKTLNNLNHWLKRRRVIADLGDRYVTLEDIK